MNRIDYDLIVNELSKGLRNAEHALTLYGQNIEFYGPDMYFQEFRTVGLLGSRQQGKSSWLVGKVDSDPKSLLVVRDEMMLRCMILNYENQVERVSVIGERAITLDDLKVAIVSDSLPLYDTYYIDEASHCYHFVKRALFEYLWKKKHYLAKIVLVG